jgi:hypothetical protein
VDGDRCGCAAEGVIRMTDRWIITVSLSFAGVVPFALAGGLSGDTTIMGSVGFLTQAGFVFGMIGYRRRWWCRPTASGSC